jgi:hypothetical protein
MERGHDHMDPAEDLSDPRKNTFDPEKPQPVSPDTIGGGGGGLDGESGKDGSTEGERGAEVTATLQQPSKYETSWLRRLLTPRRCRWDPTSPSTLRMPLAYLYAIVRSTLTRERGETIPSSLPLTLYGQHGGC